ncbi:MAG: beta-lactamase family protein [Proteobacteria bacterium]|nr:beta-lactamase family protein [Pseudomonadota bacterium]
MYTHTRLILLFSVASIFLMMGCAKTTHQSQPQTPVNPALASQEFPKTPNSFVFHNTESESSKAALEMLLPYAVPFVERGYNEGLVISVITPDGVSTKGLGTLDIESPQHAQMELGSVNKVFIGMAFASMVNDGIVKVDTPLSACLPEGIDIPGSESITLGMLATHTSGLPRLPDSLTELIESTNTKDPYRTYPISQMWADLAKTKINPDHNLEYSNFGASILAHALAVCAKEQSWETLIAHRVTDVLELHSVSAHPSAPLVQGYDEEGNPAQAWSFDEGMAPAGALTAKAEDIAKLVQMFLVEDSFPGREMLKTSIQPLFAVDSQNTPNTPNMLPVNEVAMNWLLGVGNLSQLFGETSVQDSMKELIWHNGRTGTASSSIAFIPDKKIGVVILSDTSTENPLTMSLFGLGRILGESADRMNMLVNAIAKPR